MHDVLNKKVINTNVLAALTARTFLMAYRISTNKSTRIISILIVSTAEVSMH